jgi:glycerophosphoryl diester phosphodiesterase
MKKYKAKYLNFFPTILVILSITMNTCSNQSKNSLDVQGHRGARGLRPENTLSGFEFAMDLGVTTIEMDIGISQDLVPVVYHDAYINSKICLSYDEPFPLDMDQHYLLKDLTLAQIQSFDCGSLNPNIEHFPEPPRINIPEENIPSLQEVFDLAKAKNSSVRFNIEIKLDPTKDETVSIDLFVESVVNVIEKNNLINRVMIQSFNWAVLERVKKLQAKIITAALLDENTGLPTESGEASPWTNGIHYKKVDESSLGLLNEAQEYVDIFSPSGLIIVQGSSVFMNSTIEEIQAAGYKVVPWTVNKKSQMEFLINLGVDGIITDYPDILISLLKEMNISVQ